jgi:hypothetical protein
LQSVSLAIFVYFFSFFTRFPHKLLEQQDNVAMIAMGNGTPPTWFDLQTQQLDFNKVSLQVYNGNALKVS